MLPAGDLIVEYQPAIPKGVGARVVGRHRSFLVAPASRAASRRPRVRIEDFLNEPFVVFNSALSQHALQLGALPALGAEPKVFRSAGSRSQSWCRCAAMGTRFPVVASWRTRRDPDPVVTAVLDRAPS